MSISEIADRLVLTASIEGNVFPKSERDALFPLAIQAGQEPIFVHGSLYARSIEIGVGDITVHGPMATRGDVVVKPGPGTFQAMGGMTSLAGVVVGEKSLSGKQLVHDVTACRAIVKGDIVSNQSVLLNNTIVFGSISAVNCTIVNSIVLGTIHCQDQISVEMSSLGGYLCRHAVFRGTCMLFNALGESNEKPDFLPYEDIDGTLVACSIHLYPAVRAQSGMRLTREHATEHGLDLLYPDVDWISIVAEPDPLSNDDSTSERWILSIGGRIADFTKINEAADCLSEMLRVCFEFSHYNPEIRHSQLDEILKRLTPAESTILQAVCI